MIGLFLPLSLIFPQEKGLSPGIIFECRASLENLATFLYLTRVLFSPLIPDAGIADLLLKDTFFFFYLIRLTELFPFPVHCTIITDIFFTKRLTSIYVFSLPFSILLQRTFPTIKFYIQLYIDSLYQGSFLLPTCLNNSSVAGKLQDPSTVVSFFMRFPE